ncbi:L-lactate dehydrogenase 1 protein [Halorhabdus tiamatea SARL4B]|uniref:Malate dehydrogenase n=1 Tax=Halorhabdus tiamatea SARL4B TaxID=1033806 RepID=F7PG43_9EURY|nr:L-lactate dehydrogenase [Halorhabdus tiamatea]ERJ06293.1 L-lactate dehydrogenase 1 protein [Halorhabdus tiamatea SARL4B]CCQ34653.1 L-lactate dehydrogenase [Halorhabdus tiamatea SARL4B]
MTISEQAIKGKVAIIGAGDVGATTAYALMMSGSVSEIVLVDIDHEKAEGEAMDLRHGASFVKPVDIYAGDYEDAHDADVVIIAAGASQKPGETRLELLGRNVDIFHDMIPRITDGLADDAVLLVVANPVDVLSYVTWKVSGLPRHRVIGTGTVLDTARFRNVLSENCNIDARNVHAYVIGEHGDGEVLVWSATHMAGVPFDDYCPVCDLDCDMQNREVIAEEVRGAAYEIIDRKGATYYAIGLATTEIVESIIRDENSILTVSTLLDGQYGLEDVYLSLPAVVNRGGIRRVVDLDLDEREREQFVESGEMLKEEIGKLDI